MQDESRMRMGDGGRAVAEPLAARVDGALTDPSRPLPQGARVERVDADSPDALPLLRHSEIGRAHV